MVPMSIASQRARTNAHANRAACALRAPTHCSVHGNTRMYLHWHQEVARAPADEAKSARRCMHAMRSISTANACARMRRCVQWKRWKQAQREGEIERQREIKAEAYIHKIYT